MGFIFDFVGEFFSQWLMRLKSPRLLEFVSLLFVLFVLASLSIGILIEPEANRVMGAVIGVAALAVLWLIVRMLLRSKRAPS